MGIQDRDYMKKSARLREAESKKSKYRPEIKKAYEAFCRKSTFITILYVLVGLTAFFLVFNLLPNKHSIKSGKILTPSNTLDNLKNPETNHLIQHQKPTKQIQQQINPKNKSRICKILKNGEEECRFL
ncbi:MAG: hypothetical protein M0R47_01395 [Methylobacter sp.]|uniref:hypothetical protein n=1 Tax=Methylobacter sp. TaxID=2051955 RepID=UPI0025CD5B2C|nr:hypothetical protein [Methylobacter sp.]MCK9619170.1 hypothetical protein [Methylobacter sp.]